MDIYRQAGLRPGDEVRAERQGEATLYHLSNTGGCGVIAAHDLFNGVSLLYDDMHMYDFTEGSAGPCALAVEHCREGRFEAAFRDGRRFYIGPGDLCLHNMDYAELTACTMPVRHYHGITLMMRSAEDALFSAMLAAADVDFARLVEDTRAAGGVRIFRAGEALARLFSELYARPQAGRGWQRVKLLELLSLLQAAPREEDRSRFCSLPEDVADILKGAELYLWQHLSEPLTIPALAARFGMSGTSFKAYFRVLYGVPVHRYIHTCRMQVAARALVTTQDKIADIARRAGYRSESKFSAAFSAYAGTSPRAYRREGVLSEWAIVSPVRV